MAQRCRELRKREQSNSYWRNDEPKVQKELKDFIKEKEYEGE